MIPDTLKPLAVAIDTLRPYERNPRNGDLEAIKESLEANQQYRPIVVNARDNRILAGNHTYAAAIELEWEEIAATFVDVDEEQAARIVLVDNRTNDLAWNDDALIAEILNELPDLEGTGYDDDALEEILAGIEQRESEGLTDPDAVPEVPDEPVTKRGDVWCLGRHRVMCGDATSITDIEKLMMGKKAALMATDPPYGDSWVKKAQDMQAHGYVHSRAGLHGSIENDDRNVAELKEFLDEFLVAARVAGQAPFPIYVWHRAKRIVFEEALLDAGYHVHQPVIWVKPSFVIGRLHYHPRCEWAIHGWLQGGGKCPFYGERNQSDVWEVGRENDKVHPTQKPVELFAVPIRNHTRRGEVCYEPFAGSGTQVMAAEIEGRRCFALELDAAYCDVICRRFQEYTGTLPILESTKEEHDFVTRPSTA